MSLSETLIKEHILRLEVQKERDIFKMKYNVLLSEFEKYKNTEKLLKEQIEQKNNFIENLHNMNKKLFRENIILNENIAKMNKQNTKLLEEIKNLNEHNSKVNEKNAKLLEEIKNLKKVNPKPSPNERETLHHFGTTDIFDAAKKGSLEAIKYWINQPPHDSEKNTPLHYAVEGGFINIVEFFCKNNSEFKNIKEFKNSNQATPLLYGSEKSNSFESIKMLIDYGAKINCHDGNNRPLHWAANRGDLPLAQYLISKGADIDVKAYCADRPLHVAVYNQRLPIVKLFIENGADINAKGKNGKTPLHWAYIKKDESIIKYLIEKGANQNIFDFYRKTPKEC